MLFVLFSFTFVNFYGCVLEKENVRTCSFTYTAYHLRREKQTTPLR
jgi:hypothetical protein